MPYVIKGNVLNWFAAALLLLTTIILPMISPTLSVHTIAQEPTCPVHNLETCLNYSTIQKAISADETLSGHTILVDAGIYYEHVLVSKSLSLIGEDVDTTIIDGSGDGNAIAVHADGVNITGFTIRTSWTAIAILSSKNGSIYGNNMVNNDSGISLYKSSNNTATGNYLTENWEGIHLQFSSNNTIAENDIVGNLRSIVIALSSNNNISRNNIVENEDGIRIAALSSGNIVTENNVERNENCARVL